MKKTLIVWGIKGIIYTIHFCGDGVNIRIPIKQSVFHGKYRSVFFVAQSATRLCEVNLPTTMKKATIHTYLDPPLRGAKWMGVGAPFNNRLGFFHTSHWRVLVSRLVLAKMVVSYSQFDSVISISNIFSIGGGNSNISYFHIFSSLFGERFPF